MATLDEWKTAICGQLYAIRATTARAIYLPIGLPVEDEFVREMVITAVLSQDENVNLINGRDDVFHVYASERTIKGVFRHQTRIVIGGAINATLFRYLRTLDITALDAELKRASCDDQWLPNRLSQLLPSPPFGWVPFHFAVKRLSLFLKRRPFVAGGKVVAITLVGLAFDVLVFIRAQVAMARGTGAGHW